MLIKKLFCVICFILMNVLFIFGQTEIKDVYEFPIKPGTEQWKKFETIEKRIAALQISDDILGQISTEGLLETCLDFPYLIDIMHGNHAQHGFESLMAKFNGFRELFKRPDLTNALIRKYKKFREDVEGVRLLDNLEKGRVSFCHYVLEFMLTQDIVLKNFNTEQKIKQFYAMSVENKVMIQNYSDIFSNYLHDLPTNLLYAKMIVNDSDFKFENPEQEKALLDFVQAPIAIDQRIIGLVEDYLNVKYKQFVL